MVRDDKARLAGPRQRIAAAARWAVRCLISLLVLAVASKAFAGGDNITWNGGSTANSNWTTTANWGGSDPAADPGQANLIFSGATRTTSTNNFTANTTFRSLVFSAAGFTLNGNAINLGNNAGIANNATSGTNTINIGLAFTTARPISTASGATTLVNGVISGAGVNTISGAGKTIFAGTNTYTGATSISAGSTLCITSGSALGSTAAATTVVSGGALELDGGITVGEEALSIAGTGISNNGALKNVSGTNNYGGIVTLTAAATIEANADSLLNLTNNVTGNFTKTFDAIGNIVASGTVIGSNGVTKTGTGVLTLSATNTFTGALAVNAGTVRATSNASALGGATATLTLGGGNLELANDANLNFGRATTVNTSGTIFSERLTAGAGVTHTLGTLRIGAQTLTLATDASVTSGTAGLTFGAVTLSAGGATFISSATNTLLTLGAFSGNTFGFTVGGDGNTNITGVIGTTTGTLAKTGAGTLTLSAANTYTGLTTITGGTLRYGIANAISTGGVTITNGATLDVATFNDSVGTVTLTSGNIVGTTGTLTSTANFATTSGTISAPLAGTIGVAQSTSGTTVLLASNTFSGASTIAAGGVLNIRNANALGTTAAGTTITSGGALELQGGIAVGAEALTLAGTGISSGGALRNVSGTNSYGGALTQTAATSIVSVADQLTLSGTIGGAFGLTFGGAGNIVVSNTIATGANTLTKTGAGTLTLSAANTYTGATTISAGAVSASSIVVAASASNLGNATSAVVLGDGSNQGTLSYTGNTASYTRGFAVNAGGGRLDATTAGQTLTVGTGNITGSGLFTVGGAGNVTVSSTLAQSGGLTKTGAGLLTVSSSNTYSGATSIEQGTLIAERIVVTANASSLGNATSAVALGGASTSGTLSYTGTSATYTRGFTIGAAGGRLHVTAPGTTLTIATGGVSGDGSLTFSGSGSAIATSDLTQVGGLTMASTGTLALSGVNTFGGVAINSGAVRATTNAEALGAGAVTLGGGSLELANDTGLNFGRDLTVASSGTIFSERLTAGAGVTYTLGGLAIGGQTLALATDATVTSGTAAVAFAGHVTLSGNPTFDTAAGTEFVFTDGFLGGFSVTKTGGGALTLGGDGGGQANTTVSAGRLNVNSLQALGTLSGTLSLATNTTLGNTSGNGVTVGNAKAISLGSSLAFVGPSSLNLGAGITTLSATNTTIDVSGGTLTFGGNVVGNGLGITKTGTGTLVFSHLAAGAYTGNTTISQGELFLDQQAVMGGGTSTIVTVQQGAYLRVGASASLGNVSVNTWTGGLITGTVTNVNVTFTTSGTLTPSDAFINGTQTISPGIVVSATANDFGIIPATPVADRIVIQSSGTIQALSSFEIQPTQGILLASGTATFDVTASGTQRVFVESSVTGSGAFRKTGSSNIRLVGNNSYTGGTIIEQGVVGITSDSSLGAVNGGVTIAGGELVGAQTVSGSATDVTIAAERSITIGNGLTNAISAQSGNRLAYAGTISETNGGGAAGNLRVGLAGPRAGDVVFGGANTYRSSTTIAAGTLEVAVLANGGNASGLGQSSNAAANLVIQGGGKLRFGGSNGSTDRLFTLGAGGGGLDSGAGTLAFTNSGSAALAGTGPRAFTLAGSGTGHLATILADLDPANKTSLTKTGAGTWELTSAQQFTGPTSINGGSLLVNGSLASNVIAAAATTLGGSGSIDGTLSGAGLVSPGNSPGILTAGGFDPTGGLDAAFEFTQFNPNYGSQTASGNDVLWLTDASPFGGAALSGDNVIDVYFNVSTLNYLDTFEGGFITGQNQAQLLAAVQNAQYNFWFRTEGAGVRTFNNVNYNPLTYGYSDFTGARVETAAVSTSIGGDPVIGSVTRFIVVPEPGTFILAGLGLAAIVYQSHRRHVRRRDRTSSL